jgi:hypothetical protein
MKASRRFGGKTATKVVSYLAYPSTLKTEAIYSSGISVGFHLTTLRKTEVLRFPVSWVGEEEFLDHLLDCPFLTVSDP